MSDSTVWILICAGGVTVAMFLFVFAHVSSQNPFELKVDSIHKFRRGDLVTDGRDVFEVLAVRAPNRIVVFRRD